MARGRRRDRCQRHGLGDHELAGVGLGEKVKPSIRLAMSPSRRPRSSRQPCRNPFRPRPADGSCRNANRLSNDSSVQARSVLPSHCRTRGCCRNHCHPGSTRHAGVLRGGRAGTQPLLQLRPPSSTRDISDGDGDSLLLPDQHDQLLTPRDPGVEKVPLQRGTVVSGSSACTK